MNKTILAHLGAAFLLLLPLALTPTPAHAQCSNPAGVEGEIIHNDTHNVPQYCDDTNWIAMVGALGTDNYVSGPTNGLVGYWRLDESSGTNVPDTSGQGRDGTHTDATPAWDDDGGQVAGALEFAPSTDSIELGNWEVGGTGGITLSAWAYIRSLPNSGRRVISKSSVASGTHAWALRIRNTGAVNFRLNTENGYDDTLNSTTFFSTNQNAWHHITVTYDESDASTNFYINGVLDDTDTHTLGGDIDTTSGDPIAIGNNPQGAGNTDTDRSWDGFLDEVRVYNRPLNATEVSNLYNATGGAFVAANSNATQIVPSGLVGHWRLDETSGTTAVDSSGNGNDGTLTNLDFSSDSVSGMVNNAIAVATGGIDQYKIDMADVLPTTAGQPFSIAFWLNSTATSNDSFLCVDPGGAEWRLIRNGGLFRWSNSTGRVEDNINADIFNKWAHITLTYNGSTMDLLVNGESRDTCGCNTPHVSSLTTGDIRLGACGAAFGGTNLFHMDDVRVYDRVIDTDEITGIMAARDGIRYNASHRTPEYFDGNKFVSLRPGWAEPSAAGTPGGSSTVPTPLGYWKLDETSGSSIADSGSGGNNGTWTDNTDNAITTESVAGQIDDSLDFESGDDSTISISPDASIDNLSTVTACAWINPESIPADYPFIVGKMNLLSDFGWGLYINASTDELEFQTRMMGYKSTNSPNITTGSWQHVCGSWDGTDGFGGIKLYIGGVERTSVGTSGDWDASTFDDSGESLNIGFAEPTAEFDGLIDDVCIFSQVLSDAQISEIYTSGCEGGAITTGGLIGHWKFDETTGSTLTDETGANDGSFTSESSTANISSVPGAVGSAISFNPEKNEGINLGDNPDFDFSSGNRFTIAAWVRPEDTYGYSIFSRGQFNSGPANYAIAFGRYATNQTRWQVRLSDGSTQPTVYSATNTVDVGVWQHMVVTWDGTDLIMYKNASVAGTDSFPGFTLWDPGAATFRETYIGAGRNFASGWAGGIDDLRVYDRALTSAEIMQLYQMGAPVGSSTALPQGCPSVGDICDDGSIYVGLSPDGSVPMFAETSNTPSLPWNNGNSSDYVETTVTDSDTGEANTNVIVVIDSDSATAGFQPHQLLQYCYDRVAHGADDWYVPSRNEWELMWDNLIDEDADGDPETPIPGYGYNFSNGRFFTSTENSSNTAFAIDTDDSAFPGNNKNVSRRTRCVRKGPAPRCANPYGLEGQMIYNSTHDVVQYCDGARWLAIGKEN